MVSLYKCFLRIVNIHFYLDDLAYVSALGWLFHHIKLNHQFISYSNFLFLFESIQECRRIKEITLCDQEYSNWYNIRLYNFCSFRSMQTFVINYYCGLTRHSSWRNKRGYFKHGERWFLVYIIYILVPRWLRID